MATLLTGLLLTTACSDDDSYTQPDNRQEVQLLPYVHAYKSVSPQQRAPRRMPAGFQVFNPLTATEIGVFLTTTDEDPVEGLFTNASGRWLSQMEINNGTDYYIYGYMPKTAATTASAAPLESSYEKGCVLTLAGMKPMTTTDVCVIVGVKQGDKSRIGIEEVTGLRLGDFSFHGKGPTEGNFIYLLLDHLYAALDLKIKIDEQYNELRTIKVKQMKLTTEHAASLTATLTLTANNTGDDPLAIAWGTATGSSEVTLFDYTPADALDPTDTGMPLTTSFYHIGTCMFANVMLSSSTRHITLCTTYDVYDKAGNLVRPDCTSYNVLPALSSVSKGERTYMELIVKPSYLYQLSDPDLENPRVDFITN